MNKTKRRRLGVKMRTKCAYCGKRRVCRLSKAFDTEKDRVVGVAWFCSETPEV